MQIIYQLRLTVDGGKGWGVNIISQCGPTSVKRGADKLTTVPFVVLQQRLITGMVRNSNAFKGDYYDSLVIGAKTFLT